MMHAASDVSFSSHVLIYAARLTGQAFESLIEVLDVLNGNVADVGHEVGDLASAIGHLLVDVVVSENLVH